jgi:hypothetical protein
VNYWKDVLASEGANADDRTVKTANLPLPPLQEEPSRVTQEGPPTFDPSSPTKEAEDIQLSAANKQAKLMRWHYHLGHLTFPKLKQIALKGKIPKKLAKVLPPKCAGCLFGAMTKLSWQGKETKANQEVFVLTKPGECVSVDQIMLTEVGFYAQLKGKLTKKRYKCATVFVNRFSAFDSSTSNLKTSPTKLLPPSLPSSSTLQSMESRSSITTATTDIFTTTPSNKHATMQGSNSPSVGSMPTFKNGIIKQAIRDLSESAWKQLLHACACWPEVVHFALWPYALQNAAYLHNNLPVLEDGTGWSFSAQFK